MKAVRSALNSLSPDQRALLLQIVRYAVVGFGITMMQAAIYWVMAAPVGLHSQIANLIGYGVAVVAGYCLHGRYSFADPDRNGSGAAHAARGVRFFAVSLFSLALNALWVWLCVSMMGWPEWAPVPAMLFITPWAVFILNRLWVFK
ncbi:MAG: GtrA family protein [Sphingobium sp.]|nr:GtrA family protein [Sphingobium sp.]